MPTKTITIEIPDKVYRWLKETAPRNSLALEETVVLILEECLAAESARSDDPIFQPTSAKGSGHKDVAEKHDHYSYEEWPVRKT